MRSARISEHLVALIAVLSSIAHLAIAAGLIAFGGRTGTAYPLVRWSVWEFAGVALVAAVAVLVLALRRLGRPPEPETPLLMVAWPGLAATALGAGFWATAVLGAPFAPDLAVHTWFRTPTLVVALLGIVIGVRYQSRRFLAIWFAALAAQVLLNPLLWALLPRTSWWDARMLVLPLGVLVILHFSHGWPFALPEGLEWKTLVGMAGAAWAFPPLIRLYRLGEAPSPGLVWLAVMGTLNWVLCSLLVALPLYGWRFGLEWNQSGGGQRYPWPGVALLSFAAATLTSGLLPDVLPAAGVTRSGLHATVTAPGVLWPAPIAWAALLLQAARWLLLPYLALVGLEELSIWTYRRRQARQGSDDEARRGTPP